MLVLVVLVDTTSDHPVLGGPGPCPHCFCSPCVVSNPPSFLSWGGSDTQALGSDVLMPVLINHSSTHQSTNLHSARMIHEWAMIPGSDYCQLAGVARAGRSQRELAIAFVYSALLTQEVS